LSKYNAVDSESYRFGEMMQNNDNYVSRSFKATDFSTDGNPVCDFLLSHIVYMILRSIGQAYTIDEGCL